MRGSCRAPPVPLRLFRPELQIAFGIAADDSFCLLRDFAQVLHGRSPHCVNGLSYHSRTGAWSVVTKLRNSYKGGLSRGELTSSSQGGPRRRTCRAVVGARLLRSGKIVISNNQLLSGAADRHRAVKSVQS